MTMIDMLEDPLTAPPLQFSATRAEWDEVEMGQTKRHYLLCDALFRVLAQVSGDAHSVGIDNYVYYDASDDHRCVCPDGFVKLNVKELELIEVWKTWEKGAPELAIEIVSPSDKREYLPMGEKLRRYQAVGVKELIAYDAEAPRGARLRAWDRVNERLRERKVESERTPCAVLSALGRKVEWMLGPTPEVSLDALRMVVDGVIVPTPAEASVALQAELATNQAKLATNQAELAANQAKLAANQAELAANQAKLAAKDDELAAKDEEIAALRAKLANGET
jgi:Uma2 family endonuclease